MHTQQPNLEILKLSDLDLGAFATRTIHRRTEPMTLADFVKESVDLEAEERTPEDRARLSPVWQSVAMGYIDTIKFSILRSECRRLSDFGAKVRAALIDAQLTAWADKFERAVEAAKCGVTMQCPICCTEAKCQGPAQLEPADRLLPACTCSKYIAGDGSWCPRHG